VKKLLVLEELPSAMRTGYPGSMPWDTVWAFKGVIGTVPVEPDGSACFEAPAMRSLMFVLLDEDERAIKRMHSFVTLRPGETVGCVGCHERRTETPQSSQVPAALRRDPSPLERSVQGPVDLMRHVQPILDKHCVKCHNVDKQDGGICLSADMASITRSIAYVTLRDGGFLPGAQHIQSHGRDAPYASFGSRFDGFDKYLSPEHHGVRLSREELIVIWRWFDCGALYAATYAVEGMRGDSPYGIWHITRLAPKLAQHCLGCHKPEGKEPRNYVLKFKRPVKNLTRPEKSLLWLAPLPKEHEGLGLCKDPKTGRPTTLLADKNSETYRAIREEVLRYLGSPSCLGDEGFRPSSGWLGRMKQCGVVRPTFDPQNESYDPFALDQQYYRSQWCPLDRSR
jgi:hypothetical protein